MNTRIREREANYYGYFVFQMSAPEDKASKLTTDPETVITAGTEDELKPRKALMMAAGWPLLFDLFLWMIRLLSANHPSMVKWGIHPRYLDGLTGIITAPFIHADNDHLLSNTLPVLVVGTALVHFYRSICLRVVGMIWLFSGCWVWLMARDSYHIGASGLVYGGVVFLFFSGIFRRYAPDGYFFFSGFPLRQSGVGHLADRPVSVVGIPPFRQHCGPFCSCLLPQRRSATDSF